VIGRANSPRDQDTNGLIGLPDCKHGLHVGFTTVDSYVRIVHEEKAEQSLKYQGRIPTVLKPIADR
jgi:hypothetical protein